MDFSMATATTRIIAIGGRLADLLAVINLAEAGPTNSKQQCKVR